MATVAPPQPLLHLDFPKPPLPVGMAGVLLLCHAIGTAVFQNMPLYPTLTTLLIFTPLMIGGVCLLWGHFEPVEAFLTEEGELPTSLEKHPHAAKAIAIALFATALFFKPPIEYLGWVGKVLTHQLPQLLLLFSSVSLAYTLSKPVFETPSLR